MKFWNKFMKILAGLTAVAAVIYVVINYGDKIVSWTKRTFGKYFPRCCGCFEDELSEDAVEEIPTEDAVEEADFEA